MRASTLALLGSLGGMLQQCWWLQLVFVLEGTPEGRAEGQLLKAERSCVLVNNPWGSVGYWPLAGGLDTARRE